MTDPTCTATRHAGTAYAYRHGCRCPAAKAAKAAEHRRWPRTTKTVDVVAVNRACLGDRHVRLSPAERAVAVHHLTAKGRSRRWIADQLGISPRTVARHRANPRTATSASDRTAA